jgi:1,4-dihydroxy-2-naphthoyl-CoA hydrolase
VFDYRFDLGMSSADPAGVLFFPELFRHTHDAYEAFMAANGMTLSGILAQGRYAVPIVHAEADYRRPLRHGASVTVSVAVAKLGESSFTIEFQFRDAAGEACATARTVHVVIDRNTGSRSIIPEPWRVRLAAHLSSAS